MMMNFKKVAGAGIAAVTFSLMAGTAMAAPMTNTNAITYATQGIPASGAISVPVSGTPTTTVTSTAVITAGTTFQITYSLPTGVTFTANPTLAVAPATGAATVALSSGGTGNNTITYLVTFGTAQTAAGAVVFTFTTPLALTGATALSTTKTTGQFTIGSQITASTQIAAVANEATPTTTTLALSSSALSVTAGTPAAVGGVTVLAIDILSPSNGTKFFNGTTANDGVVGDDGSFTFTVNNYAPSTGIGTYGFTSTSIAETFTGNTGGIANAYLSPNATCAATPAAQAAVTGTVTGTVGSSNITFAAVPVVTYTGVARELCLYTGGTALLAANAAGFTATAAIDTTSVSLSGFNPYTYNGTASTIQYAANTSSSYASYIRIVNKSASAPIIVTASVTSDAGVTGTTQVEAGLAASNNDLVPVSTITTNAGVASQSGRYTITLFGPTGTLFESLLLNPGGVVTQIQ
jgi:hypothetical protein